AGKDAALVAEEQVLVSGAIREHRALREGGQAPAGPLSASLAPAPMNVAGACDECRPAVRTATLEPRGDHAACRAWRERQVGVQRAWRRQRRPLDSAGARYPGGFDASPRWVTAPVLDPAKRGPTCAS